MWPSRPGRARAGVLLVEDHFLTERETAAAPFASASRRRSSRPRRASSPRRAATSTGAFEVAGAAAPAQRRELADQVRLEPGADLEPERLVGAEKRTSIQARSRERQRARRPRVATRVSSASRMIVLEHLGDGRELRRSTPTTWPVGRIPTSSLPSTMLARVSIGAFAAIASCDQVSSRLFRIARPSLMKSASEVFVR